MPSCHLDFGVSFVKVTQARLVRAENGLIGTRGMVSPRQAYWRAAHLALAYTFIAGLIIHFITVTFFAGYVANGGPITWWHLAEW